MLYGNKWNMNASVKGMMAIHGPGFNVPTQIKA